MTLRPASPEMEARLKPAYDLLDRGAADGILQGGVLGVTYKGHYTTHVSIRHQGMVVGREISSKVVYHFPVIPEPLITTSVGLLLMSKQLSLDTPIFRILPEWASGPGAERRKKVTVRHLLERTAGLANLLETPDFDGSNGQPLPLFDVPLIAEPGSTARPSNIDFRLLSIIVSRLTGQGLDEYSEEHLFVPLLNGDRSTLLDSGIGALAILALGQMWLNGGIYAHHRFLHQSLVEQFTARHEIDGRPFAAGWEVRSQYTPTSHYLSLRAFGSSECYWTSLWIDPEKELVVVLLTDPAGPLADLAKLNSARAAIQDTVIEGLGIAAPR